jgi:ABC-2 type transport system permease protein
MVSATGSVPQRVAGPAALTGDWRRLVYLSVMLAYTDLKVRFFDSALGYLWSLMRPLLFFGVLYAVFSQVVRAGAGVEHYPVMLLMGIVLYTFFAGATRDAVDAVMRRENLVRKVHFPRMAIPASVVLVALFDLAMNLIVVVVFMLASGITPRWRWLELFPALALLLLFTTGVAMLLSVLYVRFRDIKPIWDVTAQMLFYVTPILYPIEALLRRSQTLGHIAMANPLAAVNQQMRYAMISPSADSAGSALGSDAALIIPVAIVLVTFAVGLWVFDRMAPALAEDL